MLQAYSNNHGFPAALPYFEEADFGQQSVLSADPFQPYGGQAQLSDAGRAGYDFHFGRQMHRNLSQDSYRVESPVASPIASNSVNAFRSAIHSLPAGPLEFGATGDDVAALQAALLAIGYFGSGTLDQCDEKGVFEDKTYASLAT
jgi:hypothetical protein